MFGPTPRRAIPDGADAWGPRFTLAGPQVVFLGAHVRRLFACWRKARRASSCFFLPRVLPDLRMTVRRSDAIRIQRLKDKLGNHANASSEVEFQACHRLAGGRGGARRAADSGDGHHDRLDCALGHHAASCARRSAIALHHAAQRQAFGKRPIEQPLMRNVLADLAIESEAACRTLHAACKRF